MPYVQQANSDALGEAAWKWLTECEERDIAETGENVARAMQTIHIGEGEGMFVFSSKAAVNPSLILR